jgi:hypothetical protein
LLFAFLFVQVISIKFHLLSNTRYYRVQIRNDCAFVCRFVIVRQSDVTRDLSMEDEQRAAGEEKTFVCVPETLDIGSEVIISDEPAENVHYCPKLVHRQKKSRKIYFKIYPRYSGLQNYCTVG